MSRGDPSKIAELNNKILANISEIERSANELLKIVAAVLDPVFKAVISNSESQRPREAYQGFQKLIAKYLHSVPAYGGYFRLANAMAKQTTQSNRSSMQADLAGGVSNTHSWNYFNSPSNKLFRAIGQGPGRVDYATADIPRLVSHSGQHIVQFENDVYSMLDKSPSYAGAYGNLSARNFEASSPCPTTQIIALAYSEWRRIILYRLLDQAKADPQWWLWYLIGQSILNMRDTEAAHEDIAKGVLALNYNPMGQGGSTRLVSGKEQMKQIDSSHKSRTRYGKLHTVLSYYNKPSYCEELYKMGVNPVLNSATLYRVESEKALIVAYQKDISKSLSEEASSQIYGLTDHLVGKVLPDGVSQSIDLALGGASLKGLGCLRGIRILDAMLPSKIYNAHTNLNPRSWIRFLSSLSVFYSVLGAYTDKQFVCDDMPSERSLMFFLWAFTDAYNTAMAYFCEVNNGPDGVYQHEVANILARTLESFLQSDPTIYAFICSTFKDKFDNQNANYRIVPPGLQGFSHLLNHQEIKAKDDEDKNKSNEGGKNESGKKESGTKNKFVYQYREDYARPLGYFKQQIVEIHQSLKRAADEDLAAKEKQETSADTLKAPTNYKEAKEACRITLTELLEDRHLPAKLRNHLLKMYEMIDFLQPKN